MKNFTTYLSVAPVISLIWLTLLAGFLIELNRFFPDSLVFLTICKEFQLFSLLTKGNKPRIRDCLIKKYKKLTFKLLQ